MGALAASAGGQAWDSVPPAEQDRFDHIMAIYAAVVAHMDTRRRPARGRAAAARRTRQHAHRSSFPITAPTPRAGRTAGSKAIRPARRGSTVFEGQSWATLSNTPLRRYKHFNHEGGIATPLIVHWPARIKTPGATASPARPPHRPDGHLRGRCRGGLSDGIQGPDDQPMEGKSLMPAFGNQPIERDAIYWEHEGNAAIRVGEWKLVRLGRNGPWELYNLKTDRTELHDLASAQPERAAQLAAKWDAWAVRAHVKPYPNEGVKGKRNNKGKNRQKQEKSNDPG